MKLLNQRDLYLKGTCEVTIKRPKDGQIVFQSSKVATNNFTSALDIGEIRAGLGNPVAIQIPGNAAVNLELTTADFSLDAIGFEIGVQPKYNGIKMTCDSLPANASDQCPTFHIDPETMELIMNYPTNFDADAFTLEGPDLYVNDPGGLSVSDYSIDFNTMELTANAATMGLAIQNADIAAYYGEDAPYCYINYAGATGLGKAYKVDEHGYIEDFTAIVGRVYNVIYYERDAATQELTIPSLIAPGIYTVTAKMAVFSTNGSGAQRGTQIGWAYYYIPRMQFSGKISVNGSQNENSPSMLSGTALSYNDAAREGECLACTYPNLAYMVYEPMRFNMDNAISQLMLIGGSLYVDIENEDGIVIPVRCLMRDGTLTQPKYSEFTFELANSDIAEITNGVLVGMEEGETTLTIGLKDGSVPEIVVNVYIS